MSEDGDRPPHNTADLPDVTDALRNAGTARRADGECHECGGQVWNVDHETICANCSLVIGSGIRDEHHETYRLPNTDRSEHSNSNAPRCAGGFPHAYEWGGDEDDPATFYDG